VVSQYQLWKTAIKGDPHGVYVSDPHSSQLEKGKAA
jgi:hypothetical protein